MTIRLRAIATLAACAMPVVAWAQRTAPALGFREDDVGLGALLGRSLLAMVIIVAVAVAVLIVLRRYGIAPGASRPGATVRVVESVRIAPRATLFVVEFGGKRVLLGHAEHGLTVIANEGAREEGAA